MGQFTLDITKFVEKTKARADEVVRKVAVDLLTRVVERSPVGNAELWAINAHAQYGRETHNLFVDQLNASVEVGQPKTRRLGRKKLAETYPLKSGKGYVGGLFRANWRVTINTPATLPVDRVDPTGNTTIAVGTEVLANFKAGPSIFLSNNLPYALPIEYGHSKQAPVGVVRVTLAEFQSMVNKAVAELKD